MANTKITNPKSFNLGASTSATQLPVMKLTERDAITGMGGGEMIFNSDTDKVEYWDGTKWYGITYKTTSESPYSAVIWQGTGTTNAITGVGFQPDLIWVKNYEQPDSSAIVDSVRGISSPAPYLTSNQTAAQGTSINMPTSVQSNGFTITGNGGRTNSINEDYIAWCFKAGGTAVSNTDGSITSQVSANVNGGFSIVTWTGNGLANARVGHGIDTPDVVITKSTSLVNDWGVAHVGIPNKIAYLQSSNAAFSGGGSNGLAGYQSAMTSTTFGFTAGSNGQGVNNVNSNGQGYVAYCWRSVPGYSKFGAYSGNGSTNGPTVTLGFEPSFLMCKETSSTGNWRIMDNTRQPSNPKNKGLWANLTNAQSTSGTNLVDFNSDNFQLVGGGSDVNASGQTYMYLAFA